MLSSGATTGDGGTDAVHRAGILEDILADRLLTPVFQPIVSLRDREILGYEALIRGPEGSALHSPHDLFGAAETAGRLACLELLARQVSIQQFGLLGTDWQDNQSGRVEDAPAGGAPSMARISGARLFLNITPEALLDPDFRSGQTLEYLRQAGVSPRQVVIEITEHKPIEDYGVMREAFAHYRAMGFAIAIDDLGAGYAGLRQWSELPPDYVKVDRHFIQDVHRQTGKRQFLHSICEIAHALGCKVIAEGVETAEELEVLYRLGVPYAQGFYFARPEPYPPRAVPAERFSQPQAVAGLWHLTEQVAGLVRERPTLSAGQRLEDVIGLFRELPEVKTLAVLERERPVGTISRGEVMNLYSSRFGRELFGRRPAAHFMNRHPLVVCECTPLESLSNRITEANDPRSVEEDFVVVDGDGRYLGVGTLLELLQRMTDLRVRNARYANPLTQLPGNVPVNEQIDRLLAAREPFTVVYCDLDNFKPFNDNYGYAYGDEVIRHVGRLLAEHAAEAADFVGHIGGDDFVLVFTSTDWEQRCRRILARFEQDAPGFYDAGDCAAGGIRATDRRGNATFYGFLSLSLGAVPVAGGAFASHLEVASRASEVKCKAKETSGNSLFIDRRR